MPFTLSHPAAVLPFARAPLVASALVIGSMVPDLPYYLPGPALATHTALGVVSVDPLLGLIAFAVWHGLLGRPALASAPSGLRARMPVSAVAGLRHRLDRVRSAGLVLVSLVVGSITHVGWDAFTHRGRFGATHFSWLAARHGPLPGYQWAQYASGVFGAAVIGVWFARWLRATPPGPARPGLAPAVAARAWLGVCLLGATGAVYGAWTVIRPPGSADLASTLFAAVTRGIASAVALMLLLAVAWHWRNHLTQNAIAGRGA